MQFPRDIMLPQPYKQSELSYMNKFLNKIFLEFSSNLNISAAKQESFEHPV